jgi:P4 family phage/plasmid primase-like protien
MDNSLLDLLRSCNNEESKEFSHATLFGPSKNWAINDSSYENFWKKYCEIAESPENNNKRLSLAEIPRKHMPIIADLTLKFHPLDGITDDPYDIDFILSIVFCYQQIIKETMKISESGIELICCVLKTDTILEDNFIVCKIRLQFPYCKTVGQIQNRLIRPLVLQMFRTTNVTARLRSQPVNDWEDIIDPLSVEKPVLMYGSSSGPNTPKFVLEYIFPQVSAEDIKESKTRVMETHETFFPQNHEQAANGIVNLSLFKTEEGEDELDHDFWLPYFLSIYYLKEVTLPKNSIPTTALSINNLSKSSKTNINKSNSHSNFNEEENLDSPEYLSTIFLGMLKKKRAQEEHYWLDVGKSLYNAFNGSERGLEKWVDFTEITDENSPEDCRSAYYNFTDAKLTIKTLAFYAREDSPEEYRKWHEVWYLPSLEKAMSLTHSDVAEAFYRVYWLEFGCSNLGKNNIYYFNKHIWKKLDSGHLLKIMISNEFVSVIEKFRIDVAMQIQDTNDKNFKDSAEIMIQKICKLIGKLKNRAFKNSIFSEICEKFFIEGFEELLDSNSDLMGCANCVIQTLEEKAVTRDGKPEDYVSKSTGVIYKFDMNEKHPTYLKLMNWLHKVFPDKELFHHASKMFAACLRGKNEQKKFPVLTGKGNNSKSMLKKLFDSAFGSYIITIPTGVFTGNKGAGGPEPAIARSRACHIAFSQEPEMDGSFKGGTIKEFTGGDKFYVRNLFTEGGEIDPMFTLMLMCNTIPIILDSGSAMKKRMVVLPFLSYWSENAPKNIDEQFKQRHFPMDTLFDKQIPEMAPAFLYFLIKMYGAYRKEGMYPEPAIIKKYTDTYWEENDVYYQFVKENIEKAVKSDGKTDDTAILSLTAVYTRFKDWHKEAFGNLKVPDRQIFKNEFENRTTKCLNRNFYGIRLKNEVVEL